MVSNAYVMVVLGILLAKGLGFYRDMVFASVFGTGVMADIYFQVFGLVNLIFTGIGVALSTLIIKNLNKPQNANNQKKYAAFFIKKSLFYLVFATILMAVFAPQIVRIILPEVSGDMFKLSVKLMYVMLPSLVFVVIAYIISGVLQNEKVFFITSIMSLPFNVVIIAALFVPDVSIYTIGIVTTLGWFLHIVILLPQFFKKGYLLFNSGGLTNIKSDKRNPEIFFIFISNMMFQLCFYSDRAFVSGDGMASTFNYASNLFVTISSVFVVAMSNVVFPSISKNYEEGNREYVNHLLKYVITILTAIFLPFILVVAFFGDDVIRLIYERGSFTAEDTKAVSTIFFIYTLGIFGYVSQELLNKILYLAGKYKYTVTVTIVVIGLNIALNFIIKVFLPDTAVTKSGLPVSTALLAITTSALLFAYAVSTAIGIRKVVGAYFKKDLILNILKIAISGALAACVYIIFNLLLPEFTHGYVTFVIPICACGIVYISSLYVSGILKVLMKNQKGDVKA